MSILSPVEKALYMCVRERASQVLSGYAACMSGKYLPYAGQVAYQQVVNSHWQLFRWCFWVRLLLALKGKRPELFFPRTWCAGVLRSLFAESLLLLVNSFEGLCGPRNVYTDALLSVA